MILALVFLSLVRGSDKTHIRTYLLSLLILHNLLECAEGNELCFRIEPPSEDLITARRVVVVRFVNIDVRETFHDLENRIVQFIRVAEFIAAEGDKIEPPKERDIGCGLFVESEIRNQFLDDIGRNVQR